MPTVYRLFIIPINPKYLMVEIPFDRQSLADFLGVERSAMSAEINRLKKSGRIDTRKNWFRVE